MSEHHDELDPELARYVEAFRAVEQPTPATAARNLAALRSTLGRRASRRWLPWVVGGAALAAAGAAAWFVGSAQTAVLARHGAEGEQAPFARPPSTHQAVTPTPAEPPRALAAPPTPPSPATTPTTSRSVDASSDTGTRAKRAKAPAAPDSVADDAPDTTLAEETRLWRAVQSHLAAGSPSEALASIEVWKRRFGSGRFVDERTLLEARALCEAGRHKESRALRDAFVTARPSSPLATRMRGICNADP